MRAELVTGWSADGKWIYFSSNSHELSGCLGRLSRAAPTAARRCRWRPIATRPEYFAAPSPAGDVVAITARANAGSQWWRKGHSHLDESEIWLVQNAAVPGAVQYARQVTNGGAKDAWPMWSGDGKSLFFMSDRSGAQNIWSVERSPCRAPTVQAPRRRSRPSRTAACCGRRSPRTAGRSPSSATSGSGRSTRRPARRARSDRAPRRAGGGRRRASRRSAIRSRSSRSRRTARRSRSRSTARSSRRRRKTAATRCASRRRASEEAELAWAPDSRRLAYVSDRDRHASSVHLRLRRRAARRS